MKSFRLNSLIQILELSSKWIVKPLLIVSFLIGFCDVAKSQSYQSIDSAKLQRHWVIDSAIDEQHHILKLLNLQNDTVYYVSIINITIGSFDRLREIDFKLSLNPDTLHLQILQSGVGWLTSISQASPEDFEAFKYAVLHQQGIWKPGFLRTFATGHTYNILMNDLKRNHLVPDDVVIDGQHSNNNSDAVLIADLRETIALMQIKEDQSSQQNIQLRFAKENDSLAFQNKVRQIKTGQHREIQRKDSVINAQQQQIDKKNKKISIGELITDAAGLATVIGIILALVKYFEKKRKERQKLEPTYPPTFSKPLQSQRVDIGQQGIPIQMPKKTNFEKNKRPIAIKKTTDGRYSIRY